QAVVQSGDVRRHFLDVVQRNARFLLAFVQEQIGQSGLSPFDLTGKHGLLAHIEVDEERGVRKKSCHAIQPTECAVGLLDQVEKLVSKLEWRLWRQRGRDEGTYRLSRRGSGQIGAGRASG